MPLNSYWSTCLGFASLVLVALFGVGGFAVEATDDALDLSAFELGLPRDRAVERGLAFLRTQAGPDGALGEQQRTALTALAVLAHLANGVTPTDPTAGPWAQKAVDFILAGQDPDGYFGRIDGSRMYGHGITTLLLAELAGTLGPTGGPREQRVREALVRAVDVILHAQRVAKEPAARGGWRYTPTDSGSDLSLSGWQLLALHACRQIGMPIPDEALRDGAAYVRTLIGDAAHPGHVGYAARNEDHQALRGLALLVLALDQGPTNVAPPEIAPIAKRIAEDPVPWQGAFFYYRVYYEAVGLSRAAPVTWATYHPRLEKLLLDHQAANGSWPAPPGDDESGIGLVYTTSMALLALSVERHLLPAHHF